MKNYFALVEAGDDKHAHSIKFPDFPSVFSAADEAKDILPHAIEALQLWAEDMPMPEPLTHEKLMARDDVRADLATGDYYLIAVPFIENDAVVVRANTTFDRGMLQAIDAEAKARGLSRSAFLASAARHEIERSHP